MSSDVRRWLVVAVLLFVGASAAWAANEPVLPPDTVPAEPGPGQKVFPYYNPVYPGDAPDPALLRVGEDIFAAVTGERLMRSRDLVHWENIGTWFGGRYPAWVDWNARHLWAPDLDYVDGRYLLYFSANSSAQPKLDGLHMGIGVAWSDRPEGPYTGADEPIAASPGFRDIDPFLFRDDDGTLYLYWGSASQPILAWQLTPDGLGTVGEPVPVLHPVPWLRYSRLLEGPWVIKRGDYYYLFWSGDGYHPGQYAVSVARSLSPLGPFERYSGNPILVEDAIWTSPGHNAIIQDDAGQDWIVYHAYEWSDTSIGRMLLIDPLIWKDGWPHVAGGHPSSGPVAAGPIWETSAIPMVEVAMNQPVRASTEREGRPARATVDGSPTTSWLPAPDDEAPWLVVDLGAERRVTKVELRFGQSGDRRYLIETSRDGETWHVLADRRHASAYPYSERGEATARYVRVSLPGPVTSEDGAIRVLRVFALDGVWLADPSGRGPVAGPLRVVAHAAADFPLAHVRIMLDDRVLYEGERMPEEAIVTEVLPDGRYSLVLEVTDTNEALWRHEVPVEVRNAVLGEVGYGAVLRGEVPLSLASGYNDEQIVHVSLALVPIRLGDPDESGRVVVYTGQHVPAGFRLDTLAVDDGTYDLRFAIETHDGAVSVSEQRVIVRNWEVLHDPFATPVDLGWFGRTDRKLTVYETPGWEYATEDPSAFFGDADRLVWMGEGTGELVWEVPGLARFLVTCYTRSAVLPDLEVSLSADGETWSAVSWEAATVGRSDAGWLKVQLSGDVTLESARYIRIAVGDEYRGDMLQLGAVEFASPAVD